MGLSKKNASNLGFGIFIALCILAILTLLYMRGSVIFDCICRKNGENDTVLDAQVRPQRVSTQSVDEASHRATVAAGNPPRTVELTQAAQRNSNPSGNQGATSDEEKGIPSPQLKQKDVTLKTKVPPSIYMRDATLRDAKTGKNLVFAPFVK